jgi:hypothetical protein
VPPSDRNPSSNDVAEGAEDTDDVVLVGASTGELRVWEAPDDGDRPVETVAAAQQTSGQVICVVLRQRGDEWLEVALPTAPAGHSGWVKRADVTLSRHRFRIEVSRSKHTLTLHIGASTVSAPVAIGTSDGPQAGTTLFITDLVRPPNRSGPYARYAYGLSGHANDLAAFQAGRGVVAIHGAGDLSTLGRDVPAGSIAVDPNFMSRMVETYGLPLGTPVDVVE